MNSVRCMDFECDHAVSFEEAMKKFLPDNLEVLPKPDEGGVPVTEYKVRVAGELWCIITGMAQGTILLDRFRGNKSQFVVFQNAIFEAFGIYNIHDGVDLHIYSPNGSIKAKKKEKE